MTSKKITTTLGSVQTSFESAWNRILMGVRAKRMPKSIKRVKQTLNMNKPHDVAYYGEREMHANTVFYTQYMGSTLVEELINPEPGANYHNTGLSTKALDRVVRMSRNKNLVDVTLSVGRDGVEVVRLPDRTAVLQVVMERMIFCANDKKYGKVTAFIARNCVNETMECHAFLFHRQKLAKSMADTLSLAFKKSKESRHEAGEDRLGNDVSMEDAQTAEKEHTTAQITGCGDIEHLQATSATKQLVYEENHNLVYAASRVEERLGTAPTSPLIDDSLEPVTRARADSDSWAVMAAAGAYDFNADLELEFSNFARSRSTTNLAALHTSVHSAWDI